MRRSLLAVVLLLAVSAPAHTQRPPRPIFSMVAYYDLRAHAIQLFYESFFVTSNRRTVGQINKSRLGGFGWLNTTYDAVAPATAFTELNRRFGENRVGLMPLECTTDPALLTTGRYELTWFGAGLRSRTMLITVVSTASPDNTCPPEVAGITTAIADYLRTAVGASTFPVGRSIPTPP